MNPVKVGFTGTREGMTRPQRESFGHTIRRLQIVEFHHGDCVGADAQAHEDVRLYWPSAKIVIHPPTDPTHRAGCRGDETREPKTHFARNRTIVSCVDIVLGASLTPTRTARGGTWYTLDYALKLGVPCQVHWPDGTVMLHPLQQQITTP